MPRGATYLRAVFDTPAGLADEAAEILVAGGALGCAVQRGGLTGARSRRAVKLEAWFTRLTPARLASLRRKMAAAGMLADSDRAAAAQRVVDPGWATLWRERFDPLPIGERFLIVPPWRREKQPPRISIIVKPAAAFGTGHHPTTAGALCAVAEACGEMKIASALDVGTGSGILAIAMALLAVKSVSAAEMDATALANARENAALNRVADRIRFSTAPISRMKGRFDLIAANILSSTLIAMAPDLTRLLSSNGRLVLGGILKRETSTVASHFRPPLRMLNTRIDRGWATMVFAR